MLVEPMYYAIFYDISLPMDVYNAMHKRINYAKYKNITDGVIRKVVELVNKDGTAFSYNVISSKTFCIVNSIDNTYFVVCCVEKVIDFSTVNKPVKWKK